MSWLYHARLKSHSIINWTAQYGLNSGVGKRHTDLRSKSVRSRKCDMYVVIVNCSCSLLFLLTPLLHPPLQSYLDPSTVEHHRKIPYNCQNLHHAFTLGRLLATLEKRETVGWPFFSLPATKSISPNAMPGT